MKNAVIFYFSGTGNTWWASNRFALKLKELGFNAETCSIEISKTAINQRFEKADLIFLNYPIYGSDRPEIVKNFIKCMPDTKTKIPFGIICTQLMFSGDGAWLEHKTIEQKGYKINWALHLKMPNNISIPGFPFRYTNEKSSLNNILQKAEKRLLKIAVFVSAGKSFKQGTTIFSNLLGLIQRGPYRHMYKSLQNDVSINPETCTKCGKCIKLCPVGNIKFADEAIGGFPEFQAHCNLCLRCYSFCPTQAILYMAKPFKPKSDGRSVPYRGPIENFNPNILKQPED